MLHGVFEGTQDAKRIILYFLGNFVHALAIFLAWKSPLKFQKWHAPVLILSYHTYLLNDPQVVAASSICSYLIGIMIFGYASAVLVSINWLPTTIASTIGQLASLVFYTRGIGFRIEDVFLCFIAAIVVTSFSAYSCEKKMKREFV